MHLCVIYLAGLFSSSGLLYGIFNRLVHSTCLLLHFSSSFFIFTCFHPIVIRACSRPPHHQTSLRSTRTTTTRTTTTATETTMADQTQEEKTRRAAELAEQAKLPYKWTQSIRDVDVTIPVPGHLRGKDLDVVLVKDRIRVGVKGETPIIEVRF